MPTEHEHRYLIPVLPDMDIEGIVDSIIDIERLDQCYLANDTDRKMCDRLRLKQSQLHSTVQMKLPKTTNFTLDGKKGVFG